MAAGVRKFSVFESKHPTGLGCRGTGGVYFNDFVKERSCHLTRPPAAAFRETQLQHVSSVLFDLDLGEGDEELFASEEKSAIVQHLEALLEPSTSLERQISNDVQSLVLRHGNRHNGTAFDASDYEQSQLATDLQALGYTVNIRRSVGGGVGAEGMSNLNHSFLRCIPHGATEVFIVDPKFRDQFDIIHPTTSYRRIYEHIPPILVTSEDKITPIVEYLCEEMANSFRSSGTPLPPWRRCHSLMSKWRPRRSLDVAIQELPSMNYNDSEPFGHLSPIHPPAFTGIFERKQSIGLHAGL